MEPNETRKQAKGQPDRVVVVDRLKYDELLVSRRKLERVGDRDDRLRDLDTHELFIVDASVELGMARGA